MKVAWSVTEKDKFLTYSNNTVNLYQTSPTARKEIPKGRSQKRGHIQIAEIIAADLMLKGSDKLRPKQRNNNTKIPVLLLSPACFQIANQN